MRVALLHNNSAGSKEHTSDELVGTIREEGHDVVTVADSLPELLPAVHDEPLDLIVVAGGDGTVGRAACALVGSPVPLAILPLGTANNTALALGIHGTARELVRGWRRGRVERFDIATARTGPDLLRFGEAAGWGIFPEVIWQAKSHAQPARERTVRGERALFRAVAQRAQPKRYAIDVDGHDYSGEYLLVEIMNLPFVGPQLLLSPTSSAQDGLLELVLVARSELATLLELVESESDGAARAAALPSRRAKRVTVRCKDPRFHSDGRLVANRTGADATHDVELEVGAAPVSYLLGCGPSAY
jgi:diacylglycerol kinase (ATP)